jgi:hypothetical protein
MLSTLLLIESEVRFIFAEFNTIYLYIIYIIGYNLNICRLYKKLYNAKICLIRVFGLLIMNESYLELGVVIIQYKKLMKANFIHL